MNAPVKFALLLGFVIFILHPLHAQKSRAAAGLEVETDPFAYVLGGYSLHVAYTFPRVRTSIGVFGINQPEWLLNNDLFTVFSSGYDIKMDYLFGSPKGFFTGAQATYGRDKIGLKDQAITENHWGFSFGLRTGYRFMLGQKKSGFKGLYIVPWVALMYAPGARTIQIEQEQYQQASWIPFPTVHVGWRF
jgi:hypothetical protein